MQSLSVIDVKACIYLEILIKNITVPVIFN